MSSTAATPDTILLFEGRPHFPGAPGWEGVADFALTWAMEHAGKTVAGHAAADATMMEGGTQP